MASSIDVRNHLSEHPPDAFNKSNRCQHPVTGQLQIPSSTEDVNGRGRSRAVVNILAKHSAELSLRVVNRSNFTYNRRYHARGLDRNKMAGGGHDQTFSTDANLNSAHT